MREQGHHDRRRAIGLLAAAAAILLLGALQFNWFSWSMLGRWASTLGWQVTVLLLVAALVVGSGVAWGRSRVRTVGSPGLTVKAMWMTAFAVLLLTAVVIIVLWWLATRGLNGPELIKARFDALKIGLSVGVGSGGVVALYLTWRRQRSTEADLDNRERALLLQQGIAVDTKAHQEHVAADVRHDAGERRVTELYTKAADQLGSEKAAVRLAGLYALERLAQGEPAHRQTIVNVLCAYLRMHYELPGDPPSTTADKSARDEYRERVQEREVRLAAQNILKDHLDPGQVSTFWEPINIDLTGALLDDFNLSGCHVANARFSKTTFTGAAWFEGVNFTGLARFDDASFADVVRFDRGTFGGGAVFEETTFVGAAWFDKATFVGPAWFDETIFHDKSRFFAVTFCSASWFADAAWLTNEPTFDGTSFGGKTNFDGTSVKGMPHRPASAPAIDDGF